MVVHGIVLFEHVASSDKRAEPQLQPLAILLVRGRLAIKQRYRVVLQHLCPGGRNTFGAQRGGRLLGSQAGGVKERPSVPHENGRSWQQGTR